MADELWTVGEIARQAGLRLSSAVDLRQGGHLAIAWQFADEAARLYQLAFEVASNGKGLRTTTRRRPTVPRLSPTQ